MRNEIQQLVALGPFPAEREATQEAVARHERALRAVQPPLSVSEANALVPLFGPDSCFGLAWTLLHLIETAPGWEKHALDLPEPGDWPRILRQRAQPRVAE